MTHENICPKCNSSEKVIHISTKKGCAYFSPFKDENGKEHQHNQNKCELDYRCIKCYSDFSVYDYNACWCGWTSENPGIIYHKVEIFPKFSHSIDLPKRKSWIERIRNSLGLE